MIRCSGRPGQRGGTSAPRPQHLRVMEQQQPQQGLHPQNVSLPMLQSPRFLWPCSPLFMLYSITIIAAIAIVSVPAVNTDKTLSESAGALDMSALQRGKEFSSWMEQYDFAE